MKGLLVIVFLLGLISGLMADDKADEIMNKAMEAKGGEDALNSIKKVVTESKGKVFQGGNEIELTTSMKSILPDKFYITTIVQGSKIEVTIKGIKAKVKINGRDLPMTPEKELDAVTGIAIFDLFIFKHYRDTDFTKTYGGETTWQDKKAHKIDLEFYSIKFSIYIDASDYKVLGKSYERNNMKLEEDYFEYKSVGGFSIPSKSVTRLNGIKYMEIETNKMEVTEEVEESIFE